MLGGTLSTSPAQCTASMFVNKTKTTLRAHTVDKNTSSVCRSKRRFRPKPHAPVLFLSIYRDTVPLNTGLFSQSKFYGKKQHLTEQINPLAINTAK